MSQENQITLRGFVTAEPKLRETVATRTPVTDLRVGCTPRRLNRDTGEWEDAPTSYFRVKAWRRLAVNVASSLHKGDMVVIRGKFYMNTWTDSEQRPRSALEIEADTVGHDLSYGWSHFLRGVRERAAERPADGGELARQEAELSDDPLGPDVPDHLNDRGAPDDPDGPSGSGDAVPYPGSSGWDEAAVMLVTDGNDGRPAEEEELRPDPERTVAVVS